jgi:formate hydrogenlyase subunit 3/multisubunit Na+/H+ antiporter MnhD subunit
MNHLTLITLFFVGFLSSIAVFWVTRSRKFVVSLACHVVAVTASVALAWPVLTTGTAVTIPLGINTWSGPLVIVIDSVSAFFILLIDLVCFAGFLYALFYLKTYLNRKRAVILSLHLFSLVWLHASMVLVTSFRDGIAFLIAWELMSLFSFVLVLFDAGKESTLKTGINYLIQMHMSFALIMLGFLAGANDSVIGFDPVKSYFENNSNLGLFLLFFAGFGIKAGFIPLHTWLPRAHPAAPAHVSGIMSGVMIKMGIYGILRISSLLTEDFFEIGLTVLVVSMVTGLLGVVLAIVQHDLKRLLAYHSIENIGIIGIGLGIALLGISYRQPVLVFGGLAGCLMHNLNHALFKSLLFFNAGNVYQATGTVNMGRLGGLAGKLHHTSVAFLVGSLAISGLPPFNGFISEFLIYNGIAEALITAGFSLAVAGVAAVLSLVLIGGLCIFCFSKAFGLTFLGTRREPRPDPVRLLPVSSHFPSILIIPLLLSVGLFPQAWLALLTPSLAALPSFHVQAQQAPAFLHTIGYVNGAVIGSVVLVWLIKRYVHQRVQPSGPTWGCGYTAGDYRHQYTPTSYAASLREIIAPALESRNSYRRLHEQEIFPEPRDFTLHTTDGIEHHLLLKPVHFVIHLLPRLGLTQTGHINHYLVYPLMFILLLSLLSYLNVL